VRRKGFRSRLARFNRSSSSFSRERSLRRSYGNYQREQGEHTLSLLLTLVKLTRANQGTAVVICQTADSPDDYVTWLDLRKKPEFYNIDPSWVTVEPIPTLSTPSYGDLTAKALVEKMKINSPKDVKQLAEAKELAYKEGFYQGVMVIGDYKGQKVEDCKVKIKDDLVRGNLCLVYSEPENTVMSRSGDECVVALCDQWYLDYGEAGWLKKAEL